MVGVSLDMHAVKVINISFMGPSFREKSDL